ncbi:uncharacterized protein LOC116340170 [Contarinia nasturtii]|uniref:uncharacterized protein LOC116340170 n=1 Tax=Contarinia nasturtii TaxID=265458 RepID=UPI0012D4B758|nr:uncharacterized protein LOC116340170 [Contarinia nasturtii]
MGVQYLTRFVEDNKLYSSINICEKIRENANAIIIFDVMGFVHLFGSCTDELNLGGRQHSYLRVFEKFVDELKKAGATLVFFCDGQLQPDRNDIWCSRRDNEFHDAMSLIGNSSNANQRKPKRFGCKTLSKSLTKLIEDKNYGDVLISTQVECDSSIAKYAAENKALAIVASDCDFLIYEGNAEWWDIKFIDMERMQANAYDPRKLRRFLHLTDDRQMKYVATIAGNDCTKSIINQKYINFKKIAQFCASLNPEHSDEEIFKKIEKYMRESMYVRANDARDCIIKSIKSYDINFNTTDIDPFDKYCSSNVLIYAFRNDAVFQYEVNFLDFNIRNHQTNQPYFNELLTVFCKLGGIILKDKSKSDPKLKIVSKYSMKEKYLRKIHQPIYPNDDVKFENLILEPSLNDDVKWNLLLWSIGIDAQLKFFLKKIPVEYVLTVLAIFFLHNKTQEIDHLQANAILKTQYDFLEKRKFLPSMKPNLNRESIRVGQLFNKTNTLLWDCFTVCGLKKFIQLDWFDGPYFGHILNRFQQADVYERDMKEIKESVTNINNFIVDDKRFQQKLDFHQNYNE